MLGEQVGEFRGTVTGQRVLPGDDYRYVKMEVSFQEAGTLFGAEATNIGTYTAFERLPGQVYGEGQGLVATTAGDSAIWNGHGVGGMAGEGLSTRFRFSFTMQGPPEGALAPLNQVLIVGEHEVDGEGNTHTRWWEWK
jgi:hypothetical protein